MALKWAVSQTPPIIAWGFCGAFLGVVTIQMYWGRSSIVGIPLPNRSSSSRRPSLSFISLAENLFSLRCVWSSKKRCDICLIPCVGHPGTFDFWNWTCVVVQVSILTDVHSFCAALLPHPYQQTSPKTLVSQWIHFWSRPGVIIFEPRKKT